MNPQLKSLVGALILLAMVVVVSWGLKQAMPFVPPALAQIDIAGGATFALGGAIFFVGLALRKMVYPLKEDSAQK